MAQNAYDPGWLMGGGNRNVERKKKNEAKRMKKNTARGRTARYQVKVTVTAKNNSKIIGGGRATTPSRDAYLRYFKPDEGARRKKTFLTEKAELEIRPVLGLRKEGHCQKGGHKDRVTKEEEESIWLGNGTCGKKERRKRFREKTRTVQRQETKRGRGQQ